MFHGIRAVLADLVRAAGSAGAVRRLAVALAFSLVALPAMAQTWTATPNVSTAGTSSNPQVKVDATGVATAVWEQAGRIYASRNAGSGWSTPDDLSGGGSTASKPQLAVDSAGDVTAIWIRDVGGQTSVLARRYSAGSWGQFAVLSSGAQATLDASVTVDSNNVVTVAWSRFNGAVYVVQASRYSAGQWGSPVDLSNAGGSAYNTRMVVDRFNTVIFVWTRDSGTEFIVQSGRWNGSVITAPIDISNNFGSGVPAYFPQVAVGSNNRVTVVWVLGLLAANNDVIQARSFLAGFGWLGIADLTAAGPSARSPQVTVDSANIFTAVWTRNNIIQASRSDGLTNWSATPYDLSLGGSAAAVDPQVTVDGANVVTAVWARHNGTNRIIQASRFTGTSWSTPADLSTTGQHADNPQVAVTSAGVATAVWARAGIIQASRFGAPAPPAAPVPTLSEWAMILFGLILASGAAVMIQRRRQVA
ncbi:IPTL-CTERM sorting domain-containing protein [Brevundimonas sp.]|uniref:IPTL-CTERM sorting domain-containing protein n=1 Tax=Brevundimonas sp. TaxID=1871086 RepID=UPI00260230CE|nr:IPTL-CTERM sorting domain-containing protein [Brevundimonas sp.]